jgi:hypothetical protein
MTKQQHLVIYFFLSLFWMAVAGLTQASAIDVRREVNPPTPRVGDPFTLTLVIKGVGARDCTVSRSFQEEAATTWTFLSPTPQVESSADGQLVRVSYRVMGLRPGVQPLPPVRLWRQQQEVGTFRVEPVEIRSRLMPDELTTSPFALGLSGPPRELLASPWLKRAPAVAGAIAGAILAAALVAYLWRAHKRRAQQASPPLPPDLAALAELERLEAEGLVAKRLFKEFYSRLSDTLRLFVGKLWGFDGLECTTSELLMALEHKSIPPAIQRELGDLLEEADLVKFAKYQPPPQACERSLQRARRIVTELASHRNHETETTAPSAGGRP